MPNLFIASTITFTTISAFVFTVVALLLYTNEAFSVSLAIGITIASNILMWLVSPSITDWILSTFHHATQYSFKDFSQRYPHLASFIEPLSVQYKFAKPTFFIIPDQNPTAFTYGIDKHNARIALSEGLFTYCNEEEVKAVIAHELGHIKNRDFVILMIANTLVQVLYIIYSNLKRSRGKNSGSAKLIALVAYILYIISIYLMYYLSRVREYLADNFAAQHVSAEHLANALIKIAYGIISVQDSDETKRLLNSTRHLGILDTHHAKHLATTAYVVGTTPEHIAKVAVYDVVSPWAFILELSSTHPLTGKRLLFLQKLASAYNQQFTIPLKEILNTLKIDRLRLYGHFIIDFTFYMAPLILFFMGYMLAPSATPSGMQFLYAFGGLILGTILQIVYKYPLMVHKTKLTILEAMQNVYASPMRGQPIEMEGTIIGRGIPGFIFSDDVMLQDKTGLMFINYHSWLGFVGNLYFALKKVQALIGQSVGCTGWFYRGTFASVSLARLQSSTTVVRSYPMLAEIVGLVVLALIVGFFGWVLLMGEINN